MPTVVARSVEATDNRTVVGRLTFDGLVADWPRVVRAALLELPDLTVTSLDDEQAFLVFRRKFAAGGGVQLDFAVGPGGSEVKARSQAPQGLHAGLVAGAAGASWMTAPGPSAVRALFDAMGRAAAT